MPAAFIIYSCVCTPTGQRYVGQTCQTCEERWDGHVRAALARRPGSKRLHNAIRKYGPDAFTHEVLEEVRGQDAANKAEAKWITKYDCRGPNGLNIAQSGGRGRSRTRRSLCQPTSMTFDSVGDLNTVRRAARYSNQSVSAFLRDAALQAAHQILAKHGHVCGHCGAPKTEKADAA